MILLTEENNNLIVMKFGGSCLQDANSFEQTTKIIRKYAKNNKLIIVTSALKGITDKLIDFYKNSCEEAPECDLIIENIYYIHKNLLDEIIDDKTPEYQNTLDFIDENIEELSQLGRIVRLLRPSMDIQDIIVSYGEKLSTFIVSQYLNSLNQGFKSQFISSDEIIITDDNFGRALPLLDETEELFKTNVFPILESDKIDLICITGFYGSTKDKNTFSNIDDHDNFGIGYELSFEKQVNIFSVTGQYLSYDEQFNKPQNKEEIDYQYRWNTTSPLEELAEITVLIDPITALQIIAGYGIVNRTHERKLINIRPLFFDFGYEVIDSIDKYYAGFAKKLQKFMLKSNYEYVEQKHFFNYDIQYSIKGNNRISVAGNYEQDSIDRGITTKFALNTLPLSLSVGHRSYNDTTFFFGNAIVNIQHKYGAIIGNIEQSQRYSQKRDENYIKVDQGTGNYVLDSLTGIYVEKEGGDYIRKVYLLQDFERVVNRNYSIEASFRQSILDMIGRFYYVEESDFKSNFGELLIALDKTPYEVEFNIRQDLLNDGRYALYEITNRERLLSITPTYKNLKARVEVKEVVERHSAFITETRRSYGAEILWRMFQSPLIKPKLGYSYSEIFSSYFSNAAILLYEPRTSLLLGLPIKTKGRFELTGELIYRDYSLDVVPYLFTAAQPPGLTKIISATASFGFNKYTVLSLIYRIDFSPDNEYRQNLRFQAKIRF